MAANKKGECTVSFDDFNTSSTIELTGVLYEVKKPEEKKVEKKRKESILELVVKPHATSACGALLHVVKSSLGTGVLASADGFKNAGILLGIVGTIIVGILCTHCTYIMVKCSQEMCAMLKKPSLGYVETVDLAMKNCGNKRYAKYAKYVKLSVEGFMFFTYYGVNTVYVLLVSDSLEQIVEQVSNGAINLGIRVYILMIAVPIYCVGMIKNMKYMIPFSALANVCLFIGLILTFYFIFADNPLINDFNNVIKKRELIAAPQKWPLFVATILFGMEGIGTMLPIENSMKKPKQFLGCPGVLTIAMSLVVTLFIMIGLFGYLRFGNEASGSITLNLGSTVLAQCVKGLVAVAILLSYGLQLTASMDVVWRGVQKHLKKENEKRNYIITRALMILGTIVIAIIVPQLAPVISLIGAVGFSMCGFFYPALVESLICLDKGFGLYKWKLWKNILLVIITIIALVSGSIVSVGDIIREYTKKD